MIYSRRKTLGSLGEFLNTCLLESKGHLVICTNFRTKYGEIDIITKKGHTIYFVESKLTTTKDQVTISRWKRDQSKRLFLAANLFIAINPNYFDYTFCILINHLDFSKKQYISINSYLYDF